MSSQILATKLYIPPPRSNMVSRPRLLECLQMDGDSKLTLISAPAGYGKTTLLSEWISQSEIPFGWLSLDQGDNNLNRFLAYFIASLQSIPVEINEEISTSFGSPQSNIYETFLIPLINHISMLERHFALVLDDYHLIQNQEIHKALTYVLDHLPPQLHLVIATRTDPPLRFAQLRARSELCEVRAEDLRFTDQEASHFLNQCMGLDLTPSDVTTLSRKTEGWITGLQLAAISLQRHHDRRAFIRAFAGDDRYIADYLLDEALGHQPPHIQTFLLQTSILDRLCASLCNTLTGRNDSQEILAELEHANLFLMSLDSQRNWFRYHHLFADLLKNRLYQTQTDQILLLHEKASSWFEANDLFSDAITHALAADDIEQIVQLSEEMAVYNMEFRESTALLAWLDRLPDADFQQHPWLLVSRSWALFNAGEYESVEMNLLELENMLRKGSIAEELASRIEGHIAAIRSYLAELREEPRAAMQQAEDAMMLLSSRDTTLRAFVAIRWANGLAWFGDLDKAISAYKEAGEFSKLAGNGQLAITALSEMAVNQMIRGELTQAVKSISDIKNYAETLAQRDGRRSPAMGILYRHLSYTKRELNALPEAAYYAKEAVDICRQWGDKEALAIALLALARVQLAQGEFEKVNQTSHQIMRTASLISPLYVLQFQHWVLHFQIHQGNLKGAEKWAQDSGLSSGDVFGYDRYLEYQNLARLFFARGEAAEAIKINEKILRVMEEVGATPFIIETLVFQAIIFDKLKRQAEAIEAMKKALTLAQAEGYVRSILCGGETIAPLLYQAAQHGMHTTYCQRLLEELEKQTPVSMGAPETSRELVEPLSEREIEVLKHIADGQTNQEIAQELILSLYTVKSHARNIYSKLGVKNRTEAVARARLLNLLPQD